MNQDNRLQHKVPPQNLEAEISLLGSLIIDKDAIIKVGDFLHPKDFYKPSHRNIYEAILELFEKREPIDFLSLSSLLKDNKKLDGVGGNAYLTELINAVPTSSHVLNYAKIVQKKRILRDLIESSRNIESLAYEEKGEVSSLLDYAEKKIFGIAEHSLQQSFLPIKDIIEETFDRIDKLSKFKGSIRGIPTGFSYLDNMLSGLQNSDLIILAARPSLGKSSLAFNIALNVAINHKMPVGIFSLEMSKDQIIDRFISTLSQIDLWKLRTGRLSSEGDDNDFQKIQRALASLAETEIYVDDSAISDVLQMRAMTRRLKADKGLGLIIIDYLQLIDSSRNSTYDSMVQQMSAISRSLKGLAKELNIPVLALSQLSRAVEQRTPQIPRLSDLRESGSIEQDADVVLFIHREDKYRTDSERKNIADIMVAKHRNGPTGKVEMYFDERTATFKDIEKGYEGSPEEVAF
ncbi:MAG: replicative DNA helicase [Candidatus Pacebacteria bacterium]|nr:replicative DNA helicase [Candidatus Paceibacterota bacterium]